MINPNENANEATGFLSHGNSKAYGKMHKWK
jgi:hypothetical protein